MAGLRVLECEGIPYDLLLRPHHLHTVPALSKRFADLDMVIDHIAKPDIKNAVLEPWATDIRTAAQNPRTMCKLSGMVTEADHKNWKPSDLTPYVEVVLDAFGTDRVMYGSELARGHACGLLRPGPRGLFASASQRSSARWTRTSRGPFPTTTPRDSTI